MSKHTPGPWDVTFQTTGNFPWSYHINAKDGQCADSEAEANAALISAAHDLLRQLKITQSFLKDRGLIAHDPDMLELFNNNAEAISDAEGGN